MNPDLSEFGTLSGDVAEAIAIANAENKPRVVGRGIYMEFLKGGETSFPMTTQVLITPEGKNEKGEIVSNAFSIRTVSKVSPRKQWRVSFLRADANVVGMSASDVALNVAGKVEDYLKRQISWGIGELRLRPIVFELTDVDFTDLSQWKPPASALRRIQKARVSVGLPEKLF